MRALRSLAALVLALIVSAPGQVNAQDWQYRVRPGDNVWDVSARYVRNRISWQRVQRYNNIGDPLALRPGTTLRIPVAWLKAQPAPARVLDVQGAATVTLPGQAPQPVSADSRVGIGARLRTAEEASLTLEFADGSRLLMQENSELTLDKLSAYGKTGMVDTRVRLYRGRISNDVQRVRGPASRFDVQTPNILSSVRGTEFRIATHGDTGSVAEVLDGAVVLDAQTGSVRLEQNQGSFTGSDGRPSAPRPLLPPAQNLSADNSAAVTQLRWTQITNAQRYRVQLAQTEDFSTLIRDEVVQDQHYPVLGLAPGRYYARVRGSDADGIEGLDATAAVTVVAAHPPFAIEPGENARVSSARPRFRWTATDKPTRYRLQLSRSGDFSQLLQDQTLAASSARAAAALAPGQYYWRVGLLGGGGEPLAFSDPIRFDVGPPEPGPAMAGSEREAGADGLHIRWPASAQAKAYRFQLSRKSDFSKLTIDREVAEPQIALTDLRAGTWYARVQAIESDGYAADFGPVQQFKLGCLPCRIAAGAGAAALLLLLL